MAAAYVQRFASYGNTAINHTVTVAANTTQGNFAVLAIRTGGGAAVSSVSDSKGNTWTVDRQTTNTSLARGAIATARLASALTTSDTITVTLASSQFANVAAFEYSGVATSSPFDQSAINNGSGTTASAGPTGTTTQADELVVGFAGTGSANTGFTPPVGWNNRASNSTNIAFSDKVVSSTGTHSASWTIPSAAWAVVIATYKAAVTVTTVTAVPASATASVVAPGPYFVIPGIGHADADAPQSAVALSVPTPVSSASATAPTATISASGDVVAVVAGASASAPAPQVAVRVSPAASSATASALASASVTDSDTAPPASATASAAAPTLTVETGGVEVVAPPARATASAPVAGKSVSDSDISPAIHASASAPPPTVLVLVTGATGLGNASVAEPSLALSASAVTAAAIASGGSTTAGIVVTSVPADAAASAYVPSLAHGSVVLSVGETATAALGTFAPFTADLGCRESELEIGTRTNELELEVEVV
jgi:hypothetical protein